MSRLFLWRDVTFLYVVKAGNSFDCHRHYEYLMAVGCCNVIGTYESVSHTHSCYVVVLGPYEVWKYLSVMPLTGIRRWPSAGVGRPSLDGEVIQQPGAAIHFPEPFTCPKPGLIPWNGVSKFDLGLSDSIRLKGLSRVSGIKAHHRQRSLIPH